MGELYPYSFAVERLGREACNPALRLSGRVGASMKAQPEVISYSKGQTIYHC